MIADLNAILERFKKPSLILLVFFTGGLFAQNSNENIKQSDQYVFEGDNLVKKNDEKPAWQDFVPLNETLRGACLL